MRGFYISNNPQVSIFLEPQGSIFNPPPLCVFLIEVTPTVLEHMP